MNPTAMLPASQLAPPTLFEWLDRSAAERRTRKAADRAARDKTERAAIEADRVRLAEAAVGPVKAVVWCDSGVEPWKQSDESPLSKLDSGSSAASVSAALRQCGYAAVTAPPGITIRPRVAVNRLTDVFRYCVEINFDGESREFIFTATLRSLEEVLKALKSIREVIGPCYGVEGRCG